jgi:hypothetical protein
VQRQIDRVANALLERTQISDQQLVEISEFSGSLADI